MAQNSPITDLDASQIIQREFDIANDAQRVNVVAGTINVTNPSVGLNGAVAPTSSSQGGGVGPDGNLHPVSTDNTGNQNVNVVSSTLPTGASTEATQLQVKADLDALNARLAGSLVPFSQDYIALTYITSGNGAGQIGTVTYKTGGASGTQTALLTLAYDASNNLISVTRT